MPKQDIERIAVLETNQSNIMKEMSEIKVDVKTILEKLDNLENKFVLRGEFKVAIGTISALAVIIGIITYFLDK